MAHRSVPSLSSVAGARDPTMSGNHVEKELQCILHWFRSFTHYQKQDFLKFLLDRALPQNMDTLFDAMGSLKVQDKPPNIFQCQLKLMGEWFAEWTDMERNNLVIQLATIDPDFVQTFNQEVMKAGQT